MTGLSYTPITPKLLNVRAMKAELERELGATGEFMRRDFEKTTASWKHKPVFVVIVEAGPPAVVIVVTEDEIYGWVDRGTPEHIILPKRAKNLKFSSGYRAKTTPGVIGSSAGGPFGPSVFSKGVIHPGTKARNFSKEIAKIWEPKFKARMSTAMGRAAKASGHAP